MKSIYVQMIEAGVAVDNHESDLYVEVNEKSQEIVDNYEFKSNVKKFKYKDQLWFDIPFAYDPFWRK